MVPQKVPLWTFEIYQNQKGVVFSPGKLSSLYSENFVIKTFGLDSDRPKRCDVLQFYKGKAGAGRHLYLTPKQHQAFALRCLIRGSSSKRPRLDISPTWNWQTALAVPNDYFEWKWPLLVKRE